jgi:hypothetical protein
MELRKIAEAYIKQIARWLVHHAYNHEASRGDASQESANVVSCLRVQTTRGCVVFRQYFKDVCVFSHTFIEKDELRALSVRANIVSSSRTESGLAASSTPIVTRLRSSTPSPPISILPMMASAIGPNSRSSITFSAYANLSSRVSLPVWRRSAEN